MQKIDEKIIKFINEHHVLTIATCNNNKPWCASCFYVYLKDENIFIFTSDIDTRHGKEFIENPFVAGNILLETSIINKIQGLQFEGKIEKPTGDLKKIAEKAYLKRFPYAVIMKTELWVVKPSLLKMTHNLLGFGKKLIWTENEGNKTIKK